MTRTPVWGLTPPAASVAPMVARSAVLSIVEHCWVYTVQASIGSQKSVSVLYMSQAMALLWALVACSEALISSLMDSGRPANALWISRILRHRSAGSAARTKLVVAIAPALTKGDGCVWWWSSRASTESKAAPVGFAPSLARTTRWPRSSMTNANVNTFEMDSIGNWWSTSPIAAVLPSGVIA